MHCGDLLRVSIAKQVTIRMQELPNAGGAHMASTVSLVVSVKTAQQENGLHLGQPSALHVLTEAYTGTQPLVVVHTARLESMQ
jgi:hypothetical protein